MAQIEAFGRPIRGVELADRLGLAPETVSRYRTEGVSDAAEKTMRLVMAAMAGGVKPWGDA